MNPVTLEDLGTFLYQMINAYEGYGFMAFCLMLASSVLVLTRRLLLGTRI